MNHEPPAGTRAPKRADGMPRMPFAAWTDRLPGWSVLALVLVVTAAVYTPILGQWFKTDDFFYLHASQTHSANEYIPEAFDFTDSAEPVGILKGAYRPLFAITILAEGDAFGLHPAAYHVVSILIHLANTVLVWLIAQRLMRRMLTANLAALVFALHPAYVPTVGWISEHTAMLATLMALVSFWSFMKARDDDRGDSRWYALSVAAYLAAIFYHPKAAPVIVAHVAYAALIPPLRVRELLRPRRWMWLLPYVAVASFPLIVGYELRARDPHELVVYRYGPHVYTNYVRYLGMSLWPSDVGSDATPANTIAACFAWLLVLAWLLLDVRRRENAVVLVWYFAAILPLTSLVFGLHPRELYVVGPALALILASLSVSVFDLIAGRPVGLWIAAATVAGVSAAAIWLARSNVNDQKSQADDAYAFVAQLRREQPVLSAADTLYVVNAPFSLVILGPVNLIEAVHVYFPEVAVQLVTESDAQKIAAAHDPTKKILRVDAR